jgi:stage II sporulation protein D
VTPRPRAAGGAVRPVAARCAARGAVRLVAALLAAGVAGCRAAGPGASAGRPAADAVTAGRGAAHAAPGPDTASGRLHTADRLVWVALAARERTVPVSASGEFLVLERGGRAVLARGRAQDSWRIERNGRALRLAGAAGDATPWREGPFVVRPGSVRHVVAHAGRRYRGELWVTATDTGLLVINRVPVEDYLRGVVPLELGTRAVPDTAALQAQAIAARSYTYVRVPPGDRPPDAGHHLTATVQHQVYGGVDAEHPVVDDAIAATSGLVLRHAGRVVDGPYSSSCGGRTAAPSEAWGTGRDEPYLTSVRDVDPRTGRPWCDLAPRHAWTATFDEPLLRAAVMRHLGARGASGSTAPVLRSVAVERRSASGRVATLVVRTDRGSVTLAGPDIRTVLRDARGALLASTFFDVDREAHRGDRVTGLTLRGLGNGHGVGMCQWGAIGRARAGQDVRTILRAYYPGTVVGFAD